METTDLLEYLVIPTLYTIVVILGLPLNLLSMWILSKKRKNSMSIYMINLTTAELLFLFCLPMKIGYHFNKKRWTLPEFMCHLYVILFFTNIYTTPMLLAAISVDRYMAIVHPLKDSAWRKAKTASRACVLVWILTTIHIMPLNAVTMLNYVNETNGSQQMRAMCYEKFSEDDLQYLTTYRLYLFFSLFVTSLAITLFSYANVLKALIAGREQRSSANRMKKNRAAKMTLVGLIIYIVCLTPYNSTHIIGFIQSRTNGFYWQSLTLMRDIGFCLSALNTLFDPLIVYIASSTFRHSLKRMFRRLPPNKVSIIMT
ncbi:free fatty acid receptor 3-like [Lampetra fluviatilis]